MLLEVPNPSDGPAELLRLALMHRGRQVSRSHRWPNTNLTATTSSTSADTALQVKLFAGCQADNSSFIPATAGMLVFTTVLQHRPSPTEKSIASLIPVITRSNWQNPSVRCAADSVDGLMHRDCTRRILQCDDELTLPSADHMPVCCAQHSVVLICRPWRPAQLVVKQLWDCGLLEDQPPCNKQQVAAYADLGEAGQVY